MIRSINRIVKWIGFTILPIGLILFAQSYFYSGETLQKSVVSAIAAVIGMIPEGLYMLTTIALVLGTMRLARRKVLLHDMKSIETLAPGRRAVRRQNRHHHRARHVRAGGPRRTERKN